MERAVAFVTTADDCGPLRLPPHCASKACQDARDEAAIADMIERGVIDP